VNPLDPQPAPITGITGGSEGLAATYARVLALAATYDTAGNHMRGWAAASARTLANGDLVESAILSPITFGEAEAAVLAATTGPDGVLVESVGWETDALLIRVTVRVLQETDDLVHGAFETVDYLVGRMVGFTFVVSAPALLAGGLSLAPLAWLTWQALPPALQQQLQQGAGGGAQSWLMQHPQVIQHLVNGGGGLLDGLWDGLTPLTPGGPFGIPTLTPDTESAAGLLAALYGEETAYAVSPTDLNVPSGAVQPGSLADVLAHIEEYNEIYIEYLDDF
jgi:hypothetical protein